MGASKVCVITEANRQNDGSFDHRVTSVWSTKEKARAELKRLENIYNDDFHQQRNWRAKTPLNQTDDLSVQQLVGSFYECQIFYSIIEKKVDQQS